MELKRETENSKTAGDFNIPLSIMDKTSRQRINKKKKGHEHYKTIRPSRPT